MLAPFFMKAHGYSIAAASMPLVVNGIGRVCSDLTVRRHWRAISAPARCSSPPGDVYRHRDSILAYVFMPMPVFSRRVDHSRHHRSDVRACRSEKSPSSNPNPTNKAASKAKWPPPWASAFTLGPLLGGFVGKMFGPQVIVRFFTPCRKSSVMISILLGGAHRSRTISQENSCNFGVREKPC